MNTATKDLNLYESGSGGELLLLNDDLSLSETLFQMIYISLFGGNVESSTTGNEIESQERKDFWANSLIFKEQKNKQMNSLTEKTLRETVLNSSGRLKIQSAVEQDLFFLKNIVNIAINVLILTSEKVVIEITLTSIDNQSSKLFQFIWDNAKNEVVIEKTI
jgi:hypothetical protein